MRSYLFVFFFVAINFNHHITFFTFVLTAKKHEVSLFIFKDILITLSPMLIQRTSVSIYFPLKIMFVSSAYNKGAEVEQILN